MAMKQIKTFTLQFEHTNLTIYFYGTLVTIVAINADQFCNGFFTCAHTNTNKYWQPVDHDAFANTQFWSFGIIFFIENW